MADKVTLAEVGSLVDATTAANNINTNSAAIVAAMNNTLSRDGTSPNLMMSSLDMNSNRILNLPAPINNSEPVRLQDMSNVIAGGLVATAPNTVVGNFSGSTSVPTGQATTGTGSVVRQNAPTFTGIPVSVTPIGGDNSTNLATTAFVQNAITASTAGVSSIGTQVGALTINGGALSSSVIPVPRYDVNQTLTNTQQAQVRKNVGTSGFVTAGQFGAVGDGVTNDTTALQAMIDACAATPYLKARLIGTTGNTFLISAPLIHKNGVLIEGTGVNTLIKMTHNGSAFHSVGTSTVNGQFHYLRDCMIQGKTASITGITKANPAVVTTSTPHGFNNGDTVMLPNVLGMTNVLGNIYTVAGVTSTTFQLSGINSTGFNTYTSAGDVVLSNSIGLDYRYATLCRISNVYFNGLANAYFVFTDSGTVGAYYNIIEGCTANNCDVGFFHFTGANSNYVLDCFCNSVRVPFRDNADGNVFNNIKAEVFQTAVDIQSSSAGSLFNLSRAENVGGVGTVFNVASGASDTIITRRPHTVSIGTFINDGGTRTIFEGKQVITTSVSIPSVSPGASADTLVSISGANAQDTYTLSPPVSIVSGLMAMPISTSGGVFIRVANVTGSASSAFGGTWVINRFRTPA